MMKRKKVLKVLLAVAAVAVVGLYGPGTEYALSQPGGFGGPGGGGRGGMGPGGGVDICEKDKDLCNLLNEMKEFCGSNKEYCEMNGLSTDMAPPSGGRGGERGERGSREQRGSGDSGTRDSGPRGGGGGAIGEMMKACMSGGSDCTKLKDGVRKQLDSAKKLKTLCETKDPEACELMKTTNAFYSENKELMAIAGQQNAAAGGEGAKPAPPEQDKNENPNAALIEACLAGTEACGQLKAGMREQLVFLNEMKEVCAGADGEDCENMKEIARVCRGDNAKCAEMKEMRAFCKSDPSGCAALKLQQQDEDIQKMKERCVENPDRCRTNIKQKRAFCNENPGECDAQTLKMLEEMEPFIEQM